MLILNILNILKRYTDADHRLSQKDIVKILQEEYDMVIDRKSIKRNLMNLIDDGYNIGFTETPRTNKKGEEEILYTDWYLERDFSDEELRLLIDGLLFSKHIPYAQCKRLIEKIEGLSNQYFKAKVKHVMNLPEHTPANKQLFYNVYVLDEAISNGRKVEFAYNDFGTDKKLHSRSDAQGNPRTYVVNPYQMVTANGRYYLICNYDKYENVGNYRVDRITNIKMLEEKVKPQSKVKGLENGLDLPKHMAEHIYMFSGPSEKVTFKVDRAEVSDVIDWFGNEVEFKETSQGELLAEVHVNLQAMRYWAMQYGQGVKVESPKSLVDQIRQDIQNMAEKYK